jgi:hypothetical protein
MADEKRHSYFAGSALCLLTPGRLQQEARLDCAFICFLKTRSPLLGQLLCERLDRRRPVEPLGSRIAEVNPA